ncbi:hypothetical protein MNEG_5098 [Monoraphidium neglectum]|uniref:Rhodanese domain-containing protein n=1 Tax=Monoraphidium neglectum TaxID=145388 RepID=A0A0D2L7N2_9CHLO|nr:hypothetical protein MNEG_5098 [Monoraphidium neglectum]KIZ02864.1 hypothetical protein MNEG_5098 [Monoraphidium neglectum]|eukprot:XP_013901883.1 hypothetical protein MNEG_5098 [Monoraphidium neglectum]
MTTLHPLLPSLPSPPPQFLRTAMYRFNGVDPIEPNLEFVQQVVKVTEGGKGVIFACEAGGTLRPSINFPAGKASRSLQAVYKALVEGGPSRVKHLDRGVYGWFQAGLPFDGSYVPDIGRLPSAADNK